MNEETLHELHKSTIKSFIKKREQQAEIAAAHSQTAKKAWLGNSRETGWRDPIVPRVVGQIGKIGQHDDALLRTATIFDKRYKKAKASADKAKLRLLRKPAATMKNEEVVTEGKWGNRLRAAAIVTGATVLGAGLGGLKHATLKNNEQQGGRQVHGSSNTFVGVGAGAGLAAGVGANEVVGGGATLAAMLARRRAKRNEEYTQVLEQMIISLTGMELEELHEAVGNHLSEDYQTPARNAQMQDMYDRAEGAFFKDLSSDKKLRNVWKIDNKNNAEQQSPRLYGKNGKIIKQTKKKKRVRVGQPGGRQGGYQGGNQIGNV